MLDANDSVAATARLASGALATIVATRFATGHANDLTLSLHGTKGALRVETDGKASQLSGCFGKDIDRNRWKKIETEPVKRNARRFADALKSGKNGDPSFRRAADMQRVIDAIFESAKSRQAGCGGVVPLFARLRGERGRATPSEGGASLASTLPATPSAPLP